MGRSCVIRSAVLFLLVALLTGCCGKFFRGQQDLVGLGISPANTTITPGTTQQFTATGTYHQPNGSTGDVTAQTTWTSSNPAVATIDANGLATGVAFGNTTIKGNCQCYNTSVTLTVGSQSVNLTSIAVTPATPTIGVARTQQFTATGTYSNNTTAVLTSSVTWSSSDTTIATISNGGQATGVATGNVTITATSGSISGNTTLTVQ